MTAAESDGEPFIVASKALSHRIKVQSHGMSDLSAAGTQLRMVNLQSRTRAGGEKKV